MGSIDSILSKIDNPTLGQALGFFMTEISYDMQRGKPMLGNLTDQIGALMKTPHFPNISHIINDLTTTSPAGLVFKPSIIAGVAGWLLDEIDMNPTVSRMGKLLKTLGFNGALGAVAASLLEHSSQSFSNGSSGGNSGSGLKSVWGGGS